MLGLVASRIKISVAFKPDPLSISEYIIKQIFVPKSNFQN